ncbi:FecR family protein [Chitinophaga jiangningensis]|uniref:FecR family protein n=1 Tax=Chitinophaga jiangningensis TaxID=1419482 RepID=A0A1M6VW97_9BACT|nr:FecR family protein [Chitinophaga jiangningensis]SHK85645.1 FecR family protein [Chitinophaga jiangningensis]
MDHYIIELLEKEHWTEEDRQRVMHYLATSNRSELQEHLLQRFREATTQQKNSEHAHMLLQKIHSQLQPAAPPVPRNRYRRLIVVSTAAAAAILAVVVWTAPHLSVTNKKTTAPASLIASKFGEDVKPGSNKATLTLGNGKTVVLEDTKDGTIPAGDEKIHKAQDELVYDHTEQSVAVNTLQTPKGGQYQVVLSDGTKVWLNAASTLTYPASFRGNTRTVTLSGEAYFEVAANANMPFYVNTPEEQVQVLGTSFNVKAYTEEKRNTTTLIEGAVKVAKAERSIVLKPGEQTVYSKSTGRLQASGGDPARAIAWKNGQFAFKNDDLKEVMQTISRWYDTDVNYDETLDISAIHVTGFMRRQANLSSTLEILELTAGVHFKIQGRTISVTR